MIKWEFKQLPVFYFFMIKEYLFCNTFFILQQIRTKVDSAEVFYQQIQLYFSSWQMQQQAVLCLSTVQYPYPFTVDHNNTIITQLFQLQPSGFISIKCCAIQYPS